jgi:hypothetical protein
MVDNTRLECKFRRIGYRTALEEFGDAKERLMLALLWKEQQTLVPTGHMSESEKNAWQDVLNRHAKASINLVILQMEDFCIDFLR